MKRETVHLMVARPDHVSEERKTLYGMGLFVRPVRGDQNWWHNGSVPGTTSLVVRTHHGFAWAALFNSRPKDGREFDGELDRLMWSGISGVKAWPSQDLFPDFRHE